LKKLEEEKSKKFEEEKSLPWTPLPFKAPSNPETQAKIEKSAFLQYMENPNQFSTCNNHIPGPNASGGCPKGHWKSWKCIRCGITNAGGNCLTGCSWQEWGWICINHW